MPEEDPRLLQSDQGQTLHWKGVDFYPGTDPVSYARRKARVFSPLPRTLFFVPSIGLGYGLVELLRALPDDCAVLCVEAYQEVMGIAATLGLPRDPRFLAVRTSDPDAAAAALRSLGTGRFRRVVETPLCAGYRLAPDIYRRIRSRLEQEIVRFWQNRLTMIAMGSLQVRNVLSNLPLLKKALDFSALSSALPAVVAGAGPSLEASLPVLHRARKRFVLVAVDTALPTLAASGIVPDVVVALEAQAANNQDFIPHPPFGDRPMLACDLSVHPSAARLFTGRICFFSSEFAPLHLWERMQQSQLLPTGFPALGSVGVAAVHAALRLTRGRVLLTGLDLSFPCGKTHARNSPHHIGMLAGCRRLAPIGQSSFVALSSRHLLRVSDKHGVPVLTDRILGSYRDSLEEEVRSSPSRVMDCGETGLPLGVQPVSTIQMEETLEGGPHAAERLLVDDSRGFPGEHISQFLCDEQSLLADVVRAATPGGTASLGPLLADADYTWTHFPDVPDLGAPDRGFVARAKVAALYYAERLRRIESVL